jgi:hypothetical protein
MNNRAGHAPRRPDQETGSGGRLACGSAGNGCKMDGERLRAKPSFGASRARKLD